MGISKIGSLFAANVDSLAARPQSQYKSQSESAASAASSPDGEAVVFSSSLGKQTSDAAAISNESRVAELKNLVSRGQYPIDSGKIAVAVFRDLA